MKNFFSDIVALACLIFAPITLILNIINAVVEGPKILMKLGTIYVLLLLIIFIVSIIVLVKTNRIKKLENKKNLLIYSTTVYTITSITVNTVAWLLQSVKSGDLWNIYTIITLTIFSIAISAVMLYSKKCGLTSRFVLYFLVTAIPYFVILVGITGFFSGATVLIPIGIYLLIYGVTVTVITVNKSKKTEKELNEKPYEKQF
jgi:hypothetical protein